MGERIARSFSLGSAPCCGQTSDHRPLTDVPQQPGRSGLGPMPPDTLLSMLADCMGTVIALACEARQVPYSDIRLDLEAEVIAEQGRLDNFHVKVHMPHELSESSRRVVRAAESLCKIPLALRHGTNIQTFETFGND